MFCRKCGSVLPEDGIFCQQCGTKIRGLDMELPEGVSGVSGTAGGNISDVGQSAEIKNSDNMGTDSVIQDAAKESAVQDIAKSPNMQATVKEPATQAATKKSAGKKVWIALMAVAVVGLAILIFKHNSGQEGIVCYLSDGVFRVQNTQGKVLEEKAVSGSVYRITRALTSEKFVVSGIGTYYWNGYKLENTRFCQDYMLSLDGDTMVYVSACRRWYNDDESTAEYVQGLIIKRKNRPDAMIVDEAPEKNIILRCLSPDGNCVGYTITENDVTEGYVYIKEESVKLGANKYPVAISKDGKYVYYIKYDGDSAGTLYVQSGTDNESRTRIGREFACRWEEGYAYFNECFVLLNKDGTEALAQVDGSTFYRKGNQEAREVADELLYPLVPEKYADDMEGILVSRSQALLMVWADSLLEQPLFRTGEEEEAIDILRLTKTAGVKNMISSIEIDSDMFFMLSEDGKIIVYRDGGELYRYSVDMDVREKIAKEVVSFTISDDAGTVFYVNEDDELYRKEGDKKAVFLIDGVYDSLEEFDTFGYWQDSESGFYGIYYPDGRTVCGDVLFYYRDSTLYQFGKNVQTVDFQEEIRDCKPTKEAVYVETWDGKSHYYISFDGKEFTEVTNNGL